MWQAGKLFVSAWYAEGKLRAATKLTAAKQLEWKIFEQVLCGKYFFLVAKLR